MSNMLNYSQLVFFDTETTSLDSNKGEIISVCVMTEDSNGKLSTWQTKIMPRLKKGSYSQRALDINGFSLEEWKGAPKFEDIATDLVWKMRFGPIIAHNAQFDVNFIQTELNRCGWKPGYKTDVVSKQYRLGYPVIDTVALSWLCLPTEKQNLNVLREHIGIDTSRAHRADTDVEDTRVVFWKCVQKLLL